MVKHAQSNRVKQWKKLESQDSKLKAAAAYYTKLKTLKQRTSYAGVAPKYGVSKSTLQQLVTGSEDMLIALVSESAEHGLPMIAHEIKAYTNSLLKARQGDNFKPVRKKWITGKPLAMQQAQCLNPTAIKSWFSLLKEQVVDAGIHPSDIYGMDESGFLTAYSGMERVYGPQGTKTQHKQGGGDRENITAIVTICADGSTIRPLIIHKGKLINLKWTNNNIANAYFTVSERGWTDGDIGLKWLFLILDGHNSHYTLQFLEYAQEHNITILGYPPHCTHALQGLDVVCFAKMKDVFKKVVANFEAEHGHDVTKADFTGLFSQAFNKSFNCDTVQAAFKATGVYPYDPNVITEEKMKPSLPSFSKGSFPLPQPSPVKAILKAFEEHPMIDYDANEMSIDPILTYSASLSGRMGLVCQSLQYTLSGSFLVLDTPHTSATPVLPPSLESTPSLPPVDWSLVKEPPQTGWVTQEAYKTEVQDLRTRLSLAKTHIEAHQACLEAQNAQLVFQELHLQHINKVLFRKETKGSEDSGVHVDGGGAILIDEKIIEKVQEREALKKAKAEEKERRKDNRERRKEAQIQQAEQWQCMQDKYQVILVGWEVETQKLASEGVPKCSWPPKPKKPHKPTLSIFLMTDNGADDDKNEMDEDNKEVASV
ncbi:hypothetical protein D9756_005089 [Leucocoprinus leucothites]|uniref:DDE-1 domain-containing protein n=1 Tax=Leucocoprinus leucothites TaxID=201217 RepID=A0A8H5LKE7_9AGAR|nr:hypothetical protein D9756_005089 [Leucoagaricus leucothites]